MIGRSEQPIGAVGHAEAEPIYEQGVRCGAETTRRPSRVLA